MKKNSINRLFIVICICVSAMNLNSQQLNTMYFMDNVPFRNQLNPAFQPYSNFYLGLPVLGLTQFSIGNNSLTAKDFVYNQNGLPITFLHPNGNVNNFYNSLSRQTAFRAEAQVNLLSFGFRSGVGYWNFSLTEKTEGQLTIPREFMQLLLYGTPDQNNVNSFDFKKLGIDMTAYTEAGFGYSRIIDNRWTVGGKLKVLFGSANVSSTNQNLGLQADITNWKLQGLGTLNVAIPGKLTIGNNLQSFDYVQPKNASEFLNPSGMGAGIDLGLTFKPLKELTLSAAVIDLGFINWNRNVSNINYSTDYTFLGLGLIDINSAVDIKALTDSIVKGLRNSVVTSKTSKNYATYLSPKLNIGGEYSFYENKLSLGLLSRTIVHQSTLNEELTASVNGRPIDWFNMSLSYSVFNGRMSNFGAGLGVRTGFVHWFLSADYIPLSYGKTAISFGSVTNMPAPYNTKVINFAVGFNLVFGNRKDADHDGVVDRKDKCPETPFSVVVDRKGCPLDTDGDGVPDYLDKCAKTPPEAYGRIDQNGCPTDFDFDGVPDYLDKCPDTPAEAIGFVDKFGCSLDTDSDGVFDYKDKCPKTPAGVKVDSVGCPLDTDGDGVPDYKDKCPGTPVEARNMIDSVGCPLDKDKDGVPDYLDLCPNTPAEARAFVDKNGCTLDKDGDGVPDYLDKCPDTPIEARGTVDANGCPRDTDGDGVPDYLDNCPKIPGVASNKGCPEIKKEVKALFKKALQGIQFETGKYIIKPISFKILDQVARVLIENPTYLIEVQGHTDNVGKPESNLILSENRAKAVKDYLIKKGVDAGRMTSHGYGDTVPVATNKTTKGKALNRRVEFVVSFEVIVKQ